MKVKKMKQILSRIAMVLSVVTVIVSSSVVMADAEIVTSSDFVSTSYSHDYSEWHRLSGHILWAVMMDG